MKHYNVHAQHAVSCSMSLKPSIFAPFGPKALTLNPSKLSNLPPQLLEDELKAVLKILDPSFTPADLDSIFLDADLSKDVL